MTNDKGIFIKNIYYMLSYAFQVLKQSNYERVAKEEFENVQNLFASILSKGIAKQLKQGLHRDYLTRCDSLETMRGKLDFNGTIKNRLEKKQRLSCEFDELSEDTILNQILKTTMVYLIRDKSISPEFKNALKKELVFFDGVSILEPSQIQWNRIYYNRNNKSYEMLMNICYFVLDDMIQTTEAGEYYLASFSDEKMAALYEKFILEYYKIHHTYLSEVKSAAIQWNLTDENDERMIRFLPAMQSDVFLRLDDKILILDAKYYGKTMQTHFDKHSLHSANLYQIFTYVKNQDKDNTGNVAGVLVYAKTEEAITPDCMFNMGGNQIGAKTLDLNRDFREIAKQLDRIADDYFS